MRLKADPNIAELAGTAGLLLVAALDLAGLADGFTVSDLRDLEIDLHAELALELGKHDVEMLFAEAGKNHFAGLFIGGEDDGRIFAHDPAQAGGDFIFFALLLDNDRHGKRRRGELHARKIHDLLRVADRVAGVEGIELGQNADIAGGDDADIFLLVAAHGDQLAHTLAAAGARHIGGHVGGDFAGDDLHEGHFAHERVGNGLEAHCGKRAVRVALDFHIVVVVVLADLSAGLQRGGRGINQRVQQQIHAVQRCAGAGVHGIDLAGRNALGQTADDLVFRQLFAVEVLHHQFVVHGGNGFHEHFLHLVEVRVGRHIHRGSLAVFIGKSLAGAKVHIRRDGAAFHVGDHDGAELGADLFLERFKGLVEVTVFAVQLGDGKELRNAAGVGSLDGLFRADVELGTGGGDDQGAFRSAHGFIDAAFKVEFAGRVQQVDLGIFPFQRSNRSGKGALTLFLFGIEVHGGVAVADLAETVGRLCKEEHGFRQCGFTFTSVAGNGDVADVFCIVGFQNKFPLKVDFMISHLL